VEVNALEVEAATRAPETPAYDEEDDDDAEPVAATAVSGEDALRADLAASGADLFDVGRFPQAPRSADEFVTLAFGRREVGGLGGLGRAVRHQIEQGSPDEIFPMPHAVMA
jgi:hypothetical protein